MWNETLLHSVLDSLDVAVVVTSDGDDHIHFANRAFLRLVGCPASKLGHDGVSIRDLLDPTDRAREAPQRALLTQGKIDSYSIRERFLRPDGTRIWADVTLRALPHAAGQPEQVVRTIETVTHDDMVRPNCLSPISTITVAAVPEGDLAPLAAMRDDTDVPMPIRAAVRLILDNSGGRLGLTEVARRSGTSVRSLQRHFARHGLSAARVLKLIRLRRANNLLHEADTATSVTAVAFACGFTNLGHFARDYRGAFGELPSATLGRSRTMSGAVA
ncbi:helix-turn-helix domain-containing protein [Bradyrhizobium sp. 2TAF24]|uniref:AraC family transcriptional regulator n=1 Tax=Bradyrhizobium sp. 2TAF24 TaxID=3233011 RepID=UPI003F916033